jgi:hypothetical protein
MAIFIIILGIFLPLFVWWGFRRQNSQRPAKPAAPASDQLVLRPRGFDEQLLIIFTAVLGWVTIFLLYQYGNAKQLIGNCILLGPSTLALTYFALGGGLPRMWQQKGWRPLTIIPVIFWISLLAMVATTLFYK